MIVLHITFPLLLPVFLMLGGAGITAVMPMPKTSVNKNGNLLIWKHKIRVALYGIVAPPSCDAVLLEYLYQPQFGRFVFLRLDLPHNVRSLFFIENVRHNKSPCFKLNAEAWVGFRFQHNIVVAADNIGKRGIAFCFVKQAVLIYVCR